MLQMVITILILCLISACPNPNNTTQKHEIIQENQKHTESEIKKYSINLMWINQRESEHQELIFPNTTWRNRFFKSATQWAIANPTAEVNLWYDSAYVSHHAVEKTEHELQALLRDKNLQNVHMKDLRQIPIVKENPDAFSAQTPIYYRIDMFKLIILGDAIEHGKDDAAIFSDLEVGDLRPKKDRMDKNELFNPVAMENLKKYGLLLNNGPENQFLELLKGPETLTSLKHALINPNLFRAEFALNYHKEDRVERLCDLDRSVIISLQGDFHKYYDSLRSGQPIKVRPDIINRGGKEDEWVEYHPKDDGYLPFGNVLFYNLNPAILDENRDLRILREEVLEFPSKMSPKTRDVHVRKGNDHRCSDSKPVFTPPVSGDRYQVHYWK